MSGAEVQASELKTLGLTEYQARTFLALISIGVGTPRDIARESGIPYPSVYDSLRGLAQKGWVEFASTRPAIFRVREPTSMLEKITKNVNELFGRLQEQYHNVRDEASKLQLIYTVVGSDHVREKIIEMLASVISQAIIVAPGRTLLTKVGNGTLLSSINFLLEEKRKLNLKLLSDRQFEESRSHLDNKIKTRIRGSVLAVDLLVDNRRALIGLPDLSACGWVDSPIIASHFGQFLELLWNDSKQRSLRLLEEVEQGPRGRQ